MSARRIPSLLRRGGRSSTVSGGGGGPPAPPVGAEALTFAANTSTNADADTDRVSYAISDTQKPTTAMTIAMWVRPIRTVQQCVAADWNNGAATGRWCIETLTSGFRANFGNGANDTPRYAEFTGSGVPIEEWHHIAVVRNGTAALKLYIDGVEVTPTATAGGQIATLPLSSGQPLSVGIWNGKNDIISKPYEGSVYDLRVYSTALTGTDIADIFAGSAPTTGLVFHTPFDGATTEEIEGVTATVQGRPRHCTNNTVTTSAPTGGAIKLMPIGDSNTSRPASYRRELHRYLSGYYSRDVDFVGPFTTADGTPLVLDGDIEHAGISGETANGLAPQIAAWVTTYVPDIGVLMIGTNDVTAGDTTATVIADIEDCIDAFYSIASASTPLILCTLYPRSVASGLQAATDLVNADIPALIATQVGAGRIVTICDLAADLSWRDIIDASHLGKAGELKPGRRLAQTIATVLGWV